MKPSRWLFGFPDVNICTIKPNIKVSIVHDTIAPYRHLLFEKLSKNVDLIVYYCSLRHSHRKWDLWPRNYEYKYKLLPRIAVKTPVGELSLNPTIIKEVVKNRPHVIIISGYVDPTMWIAFIIAKLLKIPIIYWTEGVKEPSGILGIVTRPLRKLFVIKSTSIVVPGNLSRKYVISLGATKEKIFIAPNAIDNELFINISLKYKSHSEELKNELGLKDKIIILYVGRLIEEKGTGFLLEAYRKMRSEANNIALVIVGHDKLYKNLKNLCRIKNIRDVIFTGAITDYKQLIKYYSIADIFVLPTLGDVWGFVINEAMACGLPVVATRISQAAQEMIYSGENGYIVKEKDSEELYHALKNLICNPKLRKEMGEKSIEIVKHDFNVSHMVKGFMSAIKCVLRA